MIQWMAARSAWRRWWPAMVGACVVAGPVFLVGQCSGAQHERNKQAGSSVAVVARDGAAKETAAGERAADKSRIAGNQQEHKRQRGAQQNRHTWMITASRGRVRCADHPKADARRLREMRESGAHRN